MYGKPHQQQHPVQIQEVEEGEPKKKQSLCVVLIIVLAFPLGRIFWMAVSQGLE